MTSDAEKDALLKDVRLRKVGLCGSFRLLTTVLCALAMMLCFAHQSSMGSTMVCMTVDSSSTTPPPPQHNSTTPPLQLEGREEGYNSGSFVNSTLDPFSVISSNSSSSFLSSSSPMSSTTRSSDNGSAELPPYRYDWDKTTQGWIHSSLFVGYYVVQLPSGFLASRYGGKRVIVWGLLGSALAQLLTPWAASVSVVCLCVVRALCGFTSGFIYAPVFGILANWVPPDECSLLFGIGGSGVEMGTVVSFVTSAVACEINVIGGWPLVYYFIGGLSVVAAIVFHILVTDLPSQNRWVNDKERHHIEATIGQAGGHGHKDDKDDTAPLTNSIPVRSILLSLPVWAVVVSQIGSDWLFYLLITVIPSFMQEVMHMSTTSISLITGLPFLAIIFTVYIAGYVADIMRRRNILSTTNIRKLADFICKILAGALLVAVGFLGPEHGALFTVLYVLTFLLLAFMYLSWITNPVDLSPAYTGFITSVSETGAMWTSIVVPMLVEILTINKTAEEWRHVFYITGGIQVLTFLFYMLFGSAELQPWGRPDTETQINVSARHASDTDQVVFDKERAVSPDGSERRKRKSSLGRLSQSLNGLRTAYRSVTPFLSDTEDGSYSPLKQDRSVSSPHSRSRTRSSPSSPAPHQAGTSDIEPDYITMGGNVSADDVADIVENSYESMDFGSTRAPRPADYSVASEGGSDEPIYENVSPGSFPHNSHVGKENGVSLKSGTVQSNSNGNPGGYGAFGKR